MNRASERTPWPALGVPRAGGDEPFPQKDMEKLRAKIERFAADPDTDHHTWAEKKTNETAIKIRQGNWRAIVEIDEMEDTLWVVHVDKRSRVYRRH